MGSNRSRARHQPPPTRPRSRPEAVPANVRAVPCANDRARECSRLHRHHPIWLPANRDRPRDFQLAAMRAGPPGCDAQCVDTRYLIVDDNESFLEIVRGLLEREGLNGVSVASSYVDALRLFETLRPDV